MKIYLITLLALTLTGCAGYRQQQRKAERFYRKFPAQLAGLCAQAFPIKQELKPGRNTVLQTDTLQLAVNCPPSAKDTIVFTRYLQKIKLRVDTLYRTRTAVEDSLRMQVLVLAQTEAAAQQQKQALTTKSRSLMWLAVGLGMIVLFLMVLVVRLLAK
jgi:hypothetical protein